MIYAGAVTASQITAGTLTAGVIYGGTIAANQLIAGTALFASTVTFQNAVNGAAVAISSTGITLTGAYGTTPQVQISSTEILLLAVPTTPTVSYVALLTTGELHCISASGVGVVLNQGGVPNIISGGPITCTGIFIEGTLGFGVLTSYSSASGGSATLPTSPVGFFEFTASNGTYTYKIPYYGV